MNKRILYGVTAFLLLALMFIVLLANGAWDTTEKEVVVLGGDEDAHGCIGSAGYFWCEEKQKCLRVWEEDCNKSL